MESIPAALQTDRRHHFVSLDSLDEVCFRFRASWLAGERPTVESLLAHLAPELSTDDCLIELVCTEILARRELGEVVALDEYQRRFPALAEVLEMQLELYDALATIEWSSSAETP